MRSRIFLSLGAVALAAASVAACDSASPGATVARTSETTTAASAPAPVQADFVGVWAATPDACHRNETWRITADRLAAAGGVTCAIEGAARAPAGWAVQARCAGASDSQSTNLQFSGPTPEGSMAVSGGPFAPPAVLVRCTPPLTGAG